MSEVLTPESDATKRLPLPSGELQRLGVHLGVEGLRSVSRMERWGQRLSLASVVAGEMVDTPCGPCFVAETRYPLDHVHGRYPLSVVAETAPSPYLARLAGDEGLVSLDLRSAIFFDIETTGLGIGSGLYAFLVGFGTFEGNQFCLRQYFMPNHGEEEGLLYLLGRQMRHFVGLVSFNGRHFDLPVLQNRFVMARQEMPLAQAPHLDLLPPARRLWRKRLRSCRLSSLEAGVLGVTRESDVPGWLIPELYFDYVRYGAVEPMRQVFMHNALDVLSLVVLTARANALLRHPYSEDVEDAVERYSLALVYESCGRLDEAQRALEESLQARLPPDLQEEALRRLAALYKRTRQSEKAMRIWRSLQQEDRPEVLVELAKYYEHHLRDYRTAARLVGQALGAESLPAQGECSAEALKRRLARLKKKLGEGGLPMPHIESYSFGKVTIDGKTYTSDVIILPGGVRSGWWRKEGHNLGAEDLQEVVSAKPAALVVGTGNMGLMQVPQATLDYLAGQGIRVEVMPTAEACKRYNELAKTEQVAAALHLTC